jgi:hypothetical protein
MGKVADWIETRFSVMVRSLGLYRIEARSLPLGPGGPGETHPHWSTTIIRSRVLLRMPG